MTLKTAIDHEKHCTLNEAVKSCRTCPNEIYVEDEGTMFRGCKIDYMDVFIESVNELLRTTTSRHVKPLVNCPNHKLTTPRDKEDLSIRDWLKKVEGRLKIKNRPLNEIVDEINNNLPF